MKTTMRPSFFSLVFLLFGTFPLYAQSGSMIGTAAYNTENGQAMTLRNASFSYRETPKPRGFREHDLITVKVNDYQTYTNNSDLQRQRKLKGKAGLNEWIKFNGWGKLPTPIETEPPKVEAELDFQGRAKGQLSQSERLSFNINCRIVYIQDNGNLHIEGQDNITVGEENKSIYFSGDIRPEQVDPKDNSIPSDKVAFRNIKIIPSGNVFDATKRSYGQRFFDRWSPF